MQVLLQKLINKRSGPDLAVRRQPDEEPDKQPSNDQSNENKHSIL